MGINLTVQDSGKELKLGEQIKRFFTGESNKKYQYTAIIHVLGSILKFPIVIFLTIMALIYAIQDAVSIFVYLILAVFIIALLFFIHSVYSSYKLHFMLFKLQCTFLEKVESENLVSDIIRDKHKPEIIFKNPNDSHPLQLFIKRISKRKNTLSKIETWFGGMFMIDLILLPVLFIVWSLFQAIWDVPITKMIFGYLILFCFISLKISLYVSNVLFNFDKVCLAILGANIKEWAFSFFSKKW